MPPTRKTHKNAISGTAKDRINKPYKLHESIQIIARKKLTEKGIEVSDQNLDTIEAALEAKGGNIPEVEMLDAEVLKLKSLSDSRWDSSSPDDAEKASGPAETSRETIIAPEKRATVPTLPRLVEVRSSKGAEIVTNKASTAPESVAEKAVPSTTTAEAKNASRPKPPPASIPGTAECHNHSSGGAPTGTKPIHPPEIEALLEAERKRAANTSARLEIGSTVLKTLESVILSMKTTDNKEYLDAMNLCLRGALAHFLRTETTPVPTSRPLHPIGQQASNSGPSPPATTRTANPAVAVPQVTSTWATVARKGLPNSRR
ncbi:EKA-like protein [Blumeria hordei DH14]|uniref:EKA-like protein n=1 Tax=Blumeria graminis f. sp. hordei (strain DH14) TaxID=546991 RepID=N1J8F3_BLUG1|nr:EKA-like protein [Blumeria hordei DH14]